jgi:hypothetical protein
VHEVSGRAIVVTLNWASGGSFDHPRKEMVWTQGICLPSRLEPNSVLLEEVQTFTDGAN